MIGYKLNENTYRKLISDIFIIVINMDVKTLRTTITFANDMGAILSLGILFSDIKNYF